MSEFSSLETHSTWLKVLAGSLLFPVITAFVVSSCIDDDPPSVTPHQPPMVQPRKRDQDSSPIQPERAKDYIGKRKKVRMKVLSGGWSKTQTVCFLNSMQDYRNPDNFSVMIGTRVLKEYHFNPVAYFRGKTILVEGDIRLYKGRPEIVVDDPSQLSLASGE